LIKLLSDVIYQHNIDVCQVFEVAPHPRNTLITTLASMTIPFAFQVSVTGSSPLPENVYPDATVQPLKVWKISGSLITLKSRNRNLDNLCKMINMIWFIYIFLVHFLNCNIMGFALQHLHVLIYTEYKLSIYIYIYIYIYIWIKWIIIQFVLWLIWNCI